MILRDPIWIDPSLKGIYIIESGAERTKDVVSGKYRIGVQIIPLEYVLNQYKETYFGMLYYSKVDCIRDNSFHNRLADIIKKVEGKPYDINPCDWIKAKFDIETGNVHKENTFWCSALLTYIYCHLEILDPNLPWTIIPPKKFSHLESECLNFINCSVDCEKVIQFNDK
jgi:hypothetical protein